MSISNESNVKCKLKSLECLLEHSKDLRGGGVFRAQSLCAAWGNVDEGEAAEWAVGEIDVGVGSTGYSRELKGSE